MILTEKPAPHIGEERAVTIDKGRTNRQRSQFAIYLL